MLVSIVGTSECYLVKSNIAIQTCDMDMNTHAPGTPTSHFLNRKREDTIQGHGNKYVCGHNNYLIFASRHILILVQLNNKKSFPVLIQGNEREETNATCNLQICFIKKLEVWRFKICGTLI